MRKILILWALAIAILPFRAQLLTFPNDAPNYQEIKKDIQDSTSAYYYPKLLSRLKASDTTLNKFEYRRLYYGYIFQPQYEPYWKSPDGKELSKYFKSSKIEEKDYDDIIKLCNHSIEDFPFDLRSMNYLIYVYRLKGDEISSKKMVVRFRKTIGTILATGDGKTCETGFHVICVDHEYTILSLYKFELKSQALIGNCDYMELKTNEDNIKGLYFNVKCLFDKLDEMFKKN